MRVLFPKTNLFVMLQAALFMLPVPGHAQPTGAALSPKTMICSDCVPDSVRRASSKAPIPKQGLVLIVQSLIAPAQDWYVFDLDKNMLRSSNTVECLDHNGRRHAYRRHTWVLRHDEREEAQEVIKQVWSSPTRVQSDYATDTAWDAYLIDDKVVRHEAGTGDPGEPLAKLEELSRRIIDRRPPDGENAFACKR